MVNYGIRHDPKVITLVILSMLFPGNVGQKLLKDSGLRISDRTLRRIKEDVKDLGVGQLIKDAHRVYLLTTIDGFMDSMKLKQNMFDIVTSSDADNMEKIKAAEVILEILKQTPDLYDPALSESIHANTDKENNLQTDDNLTKKNSDEIKTGTSDAKHEENKKSSS